MVGLMLWVESGWRVAMVGLCVCVCVLLGGLIGNGGLGCWFAVCVFFAWWVCSVCVCVCVCVCFCLVGLLVVAMG